MFECLAECLRCALRACRPRCLDARILGLIFPASYEVVNWTALLVDAELPSESILQFVGAHFSEKYKWSRHKHWQGIGCSQSCGCCRSANEEDYASGCTSCNDLWEWKCVSRSTLWRVSIYNGLASRWQWE